MDAKEDAILGDNVHTHWYYVSKGRAARRILKGLEAREILDIGAGSGIFSKILLETTSAKSATGVDTAYGEERQEEWAGKPILFTRAIDKSNADLALKVEELQEQIEALHASLEVTTRQLQTISQELAAVRSMNASTAVLPPVTTATDAEGGDGGAGAGACARSSCEAVGRNDVTGPA